MDSFVDFESDDVKLVISDLDLVIDIIDQISVIDDVGFDMIIPESETRQVRLNFPLNSRIVELIEQNILDIYSTDTTPLSNIVVDGSTSYYLIRLGEMEQFAKSTDEELSTTIVEEVSRIIDSAERVKPDILAWSELLNQLEETVDSETRREFERLIEAARIENVGALDHISVAIVAAAQSGALLNDLGTWAEDVGLASKATFSRRKQNLEEGGIIYTEKVPIEIGRPKLRLMLSDEIGDIGIKGENLDISKEGGLNSQSPGSTSGKGLESTTERTSEHEESIGDDDLQLLEEELKEAIRSK